MVGFEGDELGELGDEGFWHLSSSNLVGDGGVEVAVTEDDFFCGECGFDDCFDVFESVGEEEEDFGVG